MRQPTTSQSQRLPILLERAAGIEPASLAWKAKVLPLHNARAADFFTLILMRSNGQAADWLVGAINRPKIDCHYR